MWNLIPYQKTPPTRLVRYCCRFLKEAGGENQFVITGVRWAESTQRKNNRSGLELSDSKHNKRILDDPDNPQNSVMARFCPTKGKHILNPIIDWTDEQVWEFINDYRLPYCCLYDQGYKRLGCIGCPMSGKNRKKEYEKYPKFKEAYIRAFDRMLLNLKELHPDKKITWKNGEDVLNWTLSK